MFVTRGTSLATSVLNSFEQAGATAPKAVVTAVEGAQAVIASSHQIGVQPEALIEAVTAALRAGADPAADGNVQRIIATTAISNPGILAGVESHVSADLAHTFTTQTAQCFKAWTSPFNQARVDLEDAFTILGPIRLDDTRSVVRRGVAATDAWNQAQKAVAVVQAISDGWGALAQLTRQAEPVQHRSLRIADVDAGTWLDSDSDLSMAEPWHLITMGVPLALADFAEFKARRQRIDALRRQRQQALATLAQDYNSGRRTT